MVKRQSYGGSAEAKRLREIHGGGKVSTLAENPQGTAEDAGAIPARSTNPVCPNCEAHKNQGPDPYDC